MLASCHPKMQDRIFRPVLFQLFDGKSFEEFLLSLKITLKGLKPTMTFQNGVDGLEEMFATAMSHAIDIFRLIYVQQISSDDFLESLDSYWI